TKRLRSVAYQSNRPPWAKTPQRVIAHALGREGEAPAEPELWHRLPACGAFPAHRLEACATTRGSAGASPSRNSATSNCIGQERKFRTADCAAFACSPFSRRVVS